MSHFDIKFPICTPHCFTYLPSFNLLLLLFLDSFAVYLTVARTGDFSVSLSQMKGLNFLLLKETLQVTNKNATNMGVILLASPGRDESLICFSFLKITRSHNTDFSSTRSKIDSSCLSLTVNKCYQPGVATQGRGRQVFIYLLILGQARTGT